MLPSPSSVYLGESDKAEFIFLRMANRHGLITGATGTGRKVTLQGLAEGFSDKGVSVFCVDVRGDLSGLAAAGEPKASIMGRAKQIGYRPDFRGYPVIFWDLFGGQGHPLRASPARLGPLIFSLLLGKEKSLADVFTAVFHVAKDETPSLLALPDLQALIDGITKCSDRLIARYGIPKTALDALAGSLRLLDMQGADHFLGEPTLRVSALLHKARDGRGYINILAADRYAASEQLYVAFQLFLLSELAQGLPPSGDPSRPTAIFFFESAHRLFRNASRDLLREVERILKLCGAKGVGVYFLAPSLTDIPDVILSQLGNRVLHGSRALTGAEQRSLKLNFRRNPRIDISHALIKLGTGEALVSTLDADGWPTMMECTLIKPPNSRVGPLSDAERKSVIDGSPLSDEHVDAKHPKLAYAVLQKRILRFDSEGSVGKCHTACDAQKLTGDTPRVGGFGGAVVHDGLPATGRASDNAIGSDSIGGVRPKR